MTIRKGKEEGGGGGDSVLPGWEWGRRALTRHPLCSLRHRADKVYAVLGSGCRCAGLSPGVLQGAPRGSPPLPPAQRHLHRQMPSG